MGVDRDDGTVEPEVHMRFCEVEEKLMKICALERYVLISKTEPTQKNHSKPQK